MVPKQKKYPSIIKLIHDLVTLCFWVCMMLILNVSCIDVVSEEYSYCTNKVVINGMFQTNENLEINVSETSSLKSGDFSFTNNAKIELYLNSQYLESLTYINEGNYRSQNLFFSGDTISCCMVLPENDTIWTSDVIPAKPIICDIKSLSFGGLDNEGQVFPAIEVTFKNNQEIEEYYEILITNDFGREAFIHTINDPVLLHEGLPVALFSNKSINDSVYTMRINYNTGGYSQGYSNGTWTVNHENINVSVRKVSYHYYQYKKQYYLYQQGQNFDGIEIGNTAFPLYSNVENGDGIFAAYAEQKFHIEPEPYVYKK